MRMTMDNARKKAIRARMKDTGEKFNVARRRIDDLTEPGEQGTLFSLSILDSSSPMAPSSAIASSTAHESVVHTPLELNSWPGKPAPLDPGEGTRADRLRMLQQQRTIWNELNGLARDRVISEVRALRELQAEVNAFWNRHKIDVKKRWATRTGGRGQTTVADIPEVSAQWHPDNNASPESVLATTQVGPPCLWQCPLKLGHPSWHAWPKDRIQSGAGCPNCRQLAKLADIPTLAAQYRGSFPVKEIAFAAHERVPWICRTWAVDPVTGAWNPVEHRFDAVVKERSLQGDGCRVCAGYVIDDTNSLATWFPDLASQLGDPELDPHQLGTGTHNVSRKIAREASGGVYATCPWRCQHGHRWNATILQRVQGAGCPQCSTYGISKEQVRLVAELSWLVDLVTPDRPDPRLTEQNIPDYSSHSIAIPAHLKPSHWRYKDVEVDAVFYLKSHDVRIGIEYDGAYHHSAERRDRYQYEIEKSKVLASAGRLDTIVHVRLGDLPPINAAHALSVALPERLSPFEQACAVAAAIEVRFPGSVPKLDEYLAGGLPRRQAQAESYIVAVWGQLRPPRRKPQQSITRRLRSLRETEPHPDSLLTPTSKPYRNPNRHGDIIRDYECKCGTPFTAVQSQVTSGNTRSCGCLQDEAKRQARPAISRADTGGAREWAEALGIQLNGSGRVPGRVIASYRLHRAGYLQVLGTDGLLEEEQVREWAQANGKTLGARGRVTGQLWIDFATANLNTADKLG
ncbi:hypothetical protein GBF35_46125 [Nonomuraea phyllanthi]|uniref:zinc-ribbon domain-containing protein n=1 Tax=Nonomuraea phyllanthi TaxID=2219224 RepID=UPI0012932128|nr:hypothetical protein GBF35_46125 [Nonomuraea phyllanthi]